MGKTADFQLEADPAAQAWLNAHPSDEPRVIAYDVHRCCGGGKICLVKIREHSKRDDDAGYATGALADGTRFLIDHRAAARLPARFALTVHGAGPLRHLDLALESEQWGELLYS